MALDLLFITADAGGNLPPLMAVAQELANRDHRVCLAGARPTDPRIEHITLTMIAGREPATARTGSAQMRAMTKLGMGRALAREARDIIVQRQPDVVLVDGIMINTLRLALRETPPVAVLFHSFGALWGGSMARGPANMLLRPFGLSPVDVWSAADEKLLLTDRELDPLTDAENTIGFTWTGTTEHGAPPEARDAHQRPKVVVSLSSVWQRRQDDVYQRIITALGELPVDVTVTRTAPETPFTGEIAHNARVLGRTSHSELLRSASLMIGHGGHSTTLKTLAHGVPMIVMPLNASADQPLIAKIIDDNGLGRALSSSAATDEIRRVAQELLGDRGVAENAARVGERLRAQDGARAAADAIELLGERGLRSRRAER